MFPVAKKTAGKENHLPRTHWGCVCTGSQLGCPLSHLGRNHTMLSHVSTCSPTTSEDWALGEMCSGDCLCVMCTHTHTHTHTLMHAQAHARTKTRGLIAIKRTRVRTQPWNSKSNFGIFWLCLKTLQRRNPVHFLFFGGNEMHVEKSEGRTVSFCSRKCWSRTHFLALLEVQKHLFPRRVWWKIASLQTSRGCFKNRGT